MIGWTGTFSIRDTGSSTEDRSRASAEAGISASSSSGGGASRNSRGATPKGQKPGPHEFRTMADLAGGLRLTNPDRKVVRQLSAVTQYRNAIVIMTVDWKSCTEILAYLHSRMLMFKVTRAQLCGTGSGMLRTGKT